MMTQPPVTLILGDLTLASVNTRHKYSVHTYGKTHSHIKQIKIFKKERAICYICYDAFLLTAWESKTGVYKYEDSISNRVMDSTTSPLPLIKKRIWSVDKVVIVLYVHIISTWIEIWVSSVKVILLPTKIILWRYLKPFVFYPVAWDSFSAGPYSLCNLTVESKCSCSPLVPLWVDVNFFSLFRGRSSICSSSVQILTIGL